VKISVVLCSHNGVDFIDEQLRSILNQEESPVEVIISDDASSDGTQDVIEAFIAEARETHPVIEFRFVRNVAPLGVVGNFEAALRLARGELIVLSDQDDVWRPAKLRILSGHFVDNPDLMLVHSDALLVDDSGRSLGKSLFGALRISRATLQREHQGAGFAELMKRNIVTGATVMLRSPLLERVGEFPRSWVHDEWLAVVAAVVGIIDCDERQLIHYRQHSRNQIGAQQLNLRVRVAKLGTHRLERNARLLVRARDLVSYLTEMQGSIQPGILAHAEKKLRHEVVRSGLPEKRHSRIVPVFIEMFTGRYFSCGLGLQDVLRDIVQPGNLAG
jgi:glycosyltransferase involved in cell wall biosynthesis